MSRGYTKDEIDIVALYFSELPENNLTEEEVKELCQKIANGDKNARRTLIEKNLRLVPYIATKYLGFGLPIDDLIQEGNIGLIQACEKYDINRGVKFSTYACACISGKIRMVLSDYIRLIRIPRNIIEELPDYNVLLSKLEMELERTPTVEEIAERMNITLNHAKTLSFANYRILSLEQEFDNIEDELVDPESVEDDFFDKTNMREMVRNLLIEVGLSKTEIEIIMLRYDYDKRPMSYQEIGNIYGYSKKGIQYKILSYLKRIIKSNKIDEFLQYMDDPTQCKFNLEQARLSYTRKKKK